MRVAFVRYPDTNNSEAEFWAFYRARSEVLGRKGSSCDGRLAGLELVGFSETLNPKP